MNESFIQSKQKLRVSSRRTGPQRSSAKLEAIAHAARHVLAQYGPRLTQVADVARVAGVAAGTVYLYVAEKDALIELALLSAARFDLPDPKKPFKFSQVGLRRTTKRALEERLTWPVLKDALRTSPTPETLSAVLAETYDMLQRESKLIALFDRCSGEIRVMEQLFLKGFRRQFFADFERCMEHLAAAGYVRTDIDFSAASRAAIEMLVWMAMRRPGDSEPPSCDEAAARATSIAFAQAGLTKGGEG